MFINSWPSRAVLMIALQLAAWMRIKDSPLEQSEAELLAASYSAALLNRDQEAAQPGHTRIRPLSDAVNHFVESIKYTIRHCALPMDLILGCCQQQTNNFSQPIRSFVCVFSTAFAKPSWGCSSLSLLIL